MKKWIIVATVFIMSGCARERTVSDIDVGMTRAEIISVLGKPGTDSYDGALQKLTYPQRRASGWSMRRQDYDVILLNDAVVQINPSS